MKEALETVNNLFVGVFNNILTIEENALKQGLFKNLSVTEVHTIEAIGMYEEKTMSSVAKKLNITVGTLTVAINKLVKKELVERNRCETDRRVVRIRLTKPGRLVYRVHEKFHTDMIKEAISELTEEEGKVLNQALSKINNFLTEKYYA